MTDLRPCPWCGERAKLHAFYTHSNKNKTFYYVACENSDCPVGPETPNYYTAEGAIAAWNTRHTEEESKDDKN